MEAGIKDLVIKAREGDQQAITMLYERSNRKAYYLAMQLVKDPDQAQDILQDAYLKVFTNLGMLQQPENFQGWLDTIVINKSKDYLKKKKPTLFSQIVKGEEQDGDPEFEDESGYFSPEKQVDYGETKRLVQEMIDRLPEEQRMAVVLYYLENLTVKHIALLMECSEGTIKSRLNYGRKSIKAQVLELEKKGTKLYCMPLVPFLYWMFRQQILAAVVPPAVGAAALAGGAAAGGSAAAAGISAAAGSGAAAGTGAEAGGRAAAGTGAATAGKTGLSILGKTITVKTAAIAAALCLGAGAGAAGLHFLGEKDWEVSVEKDEGDSDEQGDREVEAGEEDEAVDLTDEELAILRRVYEAYETKKSTGFAIEVNSTQVNGGYAALAETTGSLYRELYQIASDKFDNQYVLFDGNGLSETVEGEGLLLKASSRIIKGGIYEGETSYHVTGYLGNFENGKPEGYLTGFRAKFRQDTSGSLERIHISVADYDQGEIRSRVHTEEWVDNGEWNWSYSVSGIYNQEGTSAYIGTFDILVGPARDISVFDRNGNEIEGSLPDNLVFDMEITEGDAPSLPGSPIVSEGSLYMGSDFLISGVVQGPPGEGRSHYMLADDLASLVDNVVLWSAAAGADEGTGLPPEGNPGEEDDSGNPEDGAETGGEDMADSALMGPYRAAMNYPEFKFGNSSDHYLGWKAWAYTDDMPQWASGPSQILLRDGYYEVTNGAVYVPYVVPKEIVEDIKSGRIKLGDTLSLSLTDQNGEVSSIEPRLTSYDSANDLYNMSLEEEDYEDACLYIRSDGTGYIQSNLYEHTFESEIYKGSLFFSKDCKIYPSFDDTGEFITFEEYVTKEEAVEGTFDSRGYEHGMRNGSVLLYGYPVFDPETGLIVEYKEQYTP